MINKVTNTIKKYNLINADDKIVLGVSGGPDSLGLLWCLHSLNYNIVVCHINHGLRKNANLDEAFVKSFCKKLKIPFHVKHINLKNKEALCGMSTEEAGRKARYDFFYEVLKKENATLICTAHNLNDNVETVLLNIMRGSGVSGLKGIMPKTGNIIRPLIECTRDEIEAFCKDNNLKPRRDETNSKTVYTRNKIRLELIPYIKENINSDIISSITRMSQIAREEEDFVEQELIRQYEAISCVDLEDEKNIVVYSLKKFNSLHILIRKRLILKAIYNVLGNTKDIEKVHVDDIVKMCENCVGGKFLMPNKNIKVILMNKKIYFEKCN